MTKYKKMEENKMRLKKIMSLVLACAMALSLVTVASAQDTEVYFIENFDYADMAAFNAGKTATTGWKESGNGYPHADAVVNAVVEAASTNGIYNTTGHNVQPQPTLENGKFSLYGAAIPGHSSGTGSLTFFPNKMWDYVANDEYTYVISYDRSWKNNRITAAAANYGGTAGASLYWVDAEKTSASAGYIFYSTTSYTDGVAGVTYGASANVDPNANRTSMGAIDVGTEYRYAVGITKGAASGDYFKPFYTYARDGVTTEKLDNDINGTFNSANQTRTNIGAFSIHENYPCNSTIDNIRMYTIKNGFKVYAEQAKNVPLNTKSMRIYFSNPVYHSAYATPVVKKNGVAMEEGTYAVSAIKDYVGNVGGEIYSYVDVTFDTLEEAAIYTVEFDAAVVNELGTALGENNVATFETKMPEIRVNSFTLTNGALVADGSVQGAKVVLENTTSVNKNVALIYAVYAGDKLADIVYINDTVNAEKTAEFEAAVKLGATGTLKAFVWDGMSSLKPYTGAQSAAISAAAQ